MRSLVGAGALVGSVDARNDPPRSRVHFLDGLRGWAAIVVLNGHLALLLGDLNPWYTSRVMWFTTDGHLAVMVFFVLSGYALTVSHLFRSQEVLARSAVSRYFRLAIPILFVSVAAWVLRAGHAFFNIEAAPHLTILKDWLASLFGFHMSFLGAVRFALYDVFFAYDFDRSYNPALWTMTTEFVGSMLVFFYVGLFRSQGRVRWTILLGFCLISFALLPFISCFALGSLIAELDLRRPVRLKNAGWASAGFILSVVMLVSLSPTDTIDDRFGVAYAAGLVCAVSFSPPLRSFFSNPMSLWLGRISFSLYLIQFLVICSFSCAVMVALLRAGVPASFCANITFLSSLSVTLVIAAVLSRWERLSMGWSRRIADLLLLK